MGLDRSEMKRIASFALPALLICALPCFGKERGELNSILGSVNGTPISLQDVLPLTRAEEFTYPYLVKWDWYAVNLYLVTADGRLTAVPVPVDNQEYYDALTMTGRAVELLLTLGRGWGYELPVPQNTMLLGVEAEDRICTLNLSREFLSGDPRKRDLAAEALAATAIDAGNYLAVRIQLEGSDYADGRLFRKEGDWFVDGN